MARRTSKAQAPTPEPEETEETGGVVRGPGEMHELFSEYLRDEHGVEVSPEAIFHVTSKRTAFRKSDAYQDYAAALEERRAADAEAKEQRREERAKAVPAEDEGDAPAPAKRRGRKAADTPSDEVADEAQATPARGRRKPPAKRAAAEEPTEETAAPRRGRRRTGAPANF